MFLILYPLVISPVYVLLIVSGLLIFTTSSKGQGEDIGKVFYSLVVDFWYLPYVFLFLYLGYIYFYHLNRLYIGYGDIVANRDNYPGAYNLLENLCILRGYEPPFLVIKKDTIPNACSMGMNGASYMIVLTNGLLDRLKPDEIQAVLAHELAHILNGDTRFLTLVGCLTQGFGNLSTFFSDASKPDDDRQDFNIYMWLLHVVMSIGKFGSGLLLFMISKKREFIADAISIELTQNPEALIGALKKVDEHYIWDRRQEYNHLMFHYKRKYSRLLSTHPTVDERIAAICETNNLQEEDYFL